MAFVPQDRPRLGGLAGVGETLIATAEADLAPPVAEPVAIEVRAGDCSPTLRYSPDTPAIFCTPTGALAACNAAEIVFVFTIVGLSQHPPAHPQMG